MKKEFIPHSHKYYYYFYYFYYSRSISLKFQSHTLKIHVVGFEVLQKLSSHWFIFRDVHVRCSFLEFRFPFRNNSKVSAREEEFQAVGNPNEHEIVVEKQSLL